MLGEIDCRVHIINQFIKNNKNIDYNMKEIIDRYMMCVIDLKKKGYKPIVFAIHPPTTVIVNFQDIIKIVWLYNEVLKEKCIIHSVIFCNVFYELMISSDVPNDTLYIDDIHLNGKLVRSIYEKKIQELILNEPNE